MPGNTSKFKLLLVPSGVCSLSEFLLAANGAMAKVAVSKLLFTIVRLEAVMPKASSMEMEAGVVKLVPVMVTLTILPCVPFEGLME